MTRTYDHEPTFSAYSEEELSVIVGMGLFGYGGIAVHEPTEHKFSQIVQDVDYESTDPKGFVFDYSSIATVTVSGLLRWTNDYLSRAPQCRQDVKEKGPVRIEIFDNEKARQNIVDRSKLFERLGIKFVG